MNIQSFHYHGCGWAKPQVETVPSIRWETINAHHKREAVYQGHLNDGSSVQIHSTDPLYRQHGVHLRCIESATGRRIWQAIDKAGQIIAAHPKHNGCALIAHAALVGA